MHNAQFVFHVAALYHQIFSLKTLCFRKKERIISDFFNTQGNILIYSVILTDSQYSSFRLKKNLSFCGVSITRTGLSWLEDIPFMICISRYS